MFRQRARELHTEGNKAYHSRDIRSALQLYEQASLHPAAECFISAVSGRLRALFLGWRETGSLLNDAETPREGTGGPDGRRSVPRGSAGSVMTAFRVSASLLRA